MAQKKAIIFGAGPAGLTAAYELLKRTDVKPVIYEMTGDIGGIAKTVHYKGNRIDIGGHRFFSKSDRVMQWWLNIFPLSETDAPFSLERSDKVMLVRNRISRIYYLRHFFEYPISLQSSTFLKLGIGKIAAMALSYIQAKVWPLKKEDNLEEFFINRFGRVLYATFFKHYTQKVWGVSCRRISAEWGRQRIKSLSITKIVLTALKKILFVPDVSLEQKKTATSLITRFMYPKFGPGQLWEEVARIVRQRGGEIHLKCKVIAVNYRGGRVTGIQVKGENDKEPTVVDGDYFLSTMPIKELICGFGGEVPSAARQVADGLIYRDFITVGLLVKKLTIKNTTAIKTYNDLIPDTWVYVQERDVKLGRIQVFNNWSPYLVKDKDTVWLGLEFFCYEGDRFWRRSDGDITQFAVQDLITIGFIDRDDVLDSVVIRMPKAYPAYFGSYKDIDVVRSFVNGIDNLFLIGRNGMHQYNNMDHSMLTAMAAVDNIVKGVTSKENIWGLHETKEYIESE
ncbi:MAG: NAD(P)/FAD-dependent oxidoreductase [Candidatus Omnitrophica bacterium]|nr:NAD(P)/FAD-dependent oxidoreductase [Candidatus Omnitrophota bacterium]